MKNTSLTIQKELPFSGIFLSLFNSKKSNKPPLNRVVKNHPFSFLIDATLDWNFHSQNIEVEKIFSELKEEDNRISQAFSEMQIEVSFLIGQEKNYINYIFDQLYKNQKELLNEIKQTEINKTLKIEIGHLQIKNFYSNLHLRCLCFIYLNFHQYLNLKNFKRAELKFKPKAVVKPFSLKFTIERKRFQNLFEKYFLGTLVHTHTDFESFCNILTGYSIHQPKINWIANKSSLAYFINQLIINNLITKTSQPWVLVAELFTVNQKPIVAKTLPSVKNSTGLQKKKLIDKFINAISPDIKK